ncbi:MAG: molybdopterin-binding protein [Halofilum sp. (in: g-proteobacteria)]
MDRLVAFDRARQQLLARCTAIAETERVAIEQASGRRLGEACTTAGPYPARAVATTDGLAVNSAEGVGASPYNPLPASGVTAVEPGDALPAGSDAVAPWEEVTAEDGGWMLLGEVDAGQGVCRAGQLLGAGDTALEAGRVLGAGDLALLGALGGRDTICVYRRPVVTMIFAASERDVAHRLLWALLAADGAAIGHRAATTADALAEALSDAAARSDLVLVVGGTGEGRAGIAPQALERAGRLDAHGLALRPGRAAGLGVVVECPVVLVPAEPLAALTVGELLLGPALRLMAGGEEWPHRIISAPLARKAVSALGEFGYVRAAFDGERIQPRPSGTDLDLPLLARTDGFVLIAAESEGHAPGAEVTLYLDRY